MNAARPLLRWRYPHPCEAHAREEMLARIDAWWTAFERTRPQLDAFFAGGPRWDLAAWMSEHLQVIDARIMWEFGPGIPVGHRLVITPEVDRELRPLVEVLLARAPKIDGWQFHGHRLAEDFELAMLTTKGRTGVDARAFDFTAELGEAGLVDVHVAPPRGLFRNAEDDQHAAFVAVESLLGEEVVEAWIGTIDIERRKERAHLSELRARVEALIAGAEAQIPVEPYWRRVSEAGWTLLQNDAPEAEDYPGQFDIVIAKAVDVDLWRAAHSPYAFRSRRFSRCDEKICFLKVDSLGSSPERRFSDKTEIEDVCDAALVPRQLGCHIGGGIGRRYLYVDLALTDVRAAVDALRPALQARKLPLRSWILFFDDELAAEWIPIWDEAPPPPR
jgi:hypothetical protein